MGAQSKPIDIFGLFNNITSNNQQQRSYDNHHRYLTNQSFITDDVLNIINTEHFNTGADLLFRLVDVMQPDDFLALLDWLDVTMSAEGL